MSSATTQNRCLIVGDADRKGDQIGGTAGRRQVEEELPVAAHEEVEVPPSLSVVSSEVTGVGERRVLRRDDEILAALRRGDAVVA